MLRQELCSRLYPIGTKLIIIAILTTTIYDRSTEVYYTFGTVYASIFLRSEPFYALLGGRAIRETEYP
jgi:hypothetical protein